MADFTTVSYTITANYSLAVWGLSLLPNGVAVARWLKLLYVKHCCYFVFSTEKYSYQAWELQGMDIDEEEEDAEAERNLEPEPDEEEENEEVSI